MSYVATDSYRPGTPTWLQYSPNSQATTELRKSSITIVRIYDRGSKVTGLLGILQDVFCSCAVTIRGGVTNALSACD